MVNRIRIGAARLGGALALAAMATLASAADAPQAPEPYFAHPDFAGLALSPSGKYVGALVPVRGRLALAVLELDTRTPKPVARVDGEDIRWFAWANDDRLVFTTIDLQAGLGEQRVGGLYAVNRDGSDFRIIDGPGGRYTRFHSTLDDGSSDILATNNERNADFPDLVRVNTVTGRADLLTFERPGDSVFWVADRTGVARGVVTVEKGTILRSWWRPAADAKWQLIGEYRYGAPNIVPVAFDGDGSMLVASDVGRDTAALYRFDAAKNAPGELLAAHPHVDLLSGLVYDRRAKRIVGLRYEGARPGYAWFDDEWVRIAASVDKALPGRHHDLSRGGNRLLIRSSSDVDPGSWHLYDLDARRLEFVAAERKAIDTGGDAEARARPLSGARRPRDPRLRDAAAGTRGQGAAARALRARRSVGARRDVALARRARLPCGTRLRGARAGVSRQHGLRSPAVPGGLEGVGSRDAGRPPRRHRLAGAARHDRPVARVHHGRELRRLRGDDGARPRCRALPLRRSTTSA